MRTIAVFILFFSLLFKLQSVCAENSSSSEILQNADEEVVDPPSEIENIPDIIEKSAPLQAPIDVVTAEDPKKSIDVLNDTEPIIEQPSIQVTEELVEVPAQEIVPLQIINQAPSLKTQVSKQKTPLAQSKDLSFSEILADPESGNEFIEILNTTDHPLNVDGWYLCDLSTYDSVNQQCDKTKSSTYKFSHISIDSHALLTLYTKTHIKFGLNNTNEEIFIEDDFQHIIDHYTYKTSHKGRSWNSDPTQWYEETPTPNAQNMPNPLTKEYPNMILNEVFPHPKDNPNDNEFIEIYNPLNEDVSLENWKLIDASQSGSFVFSSASFTPCITNPITCLIIPKKGFVTVRRSDFDFALNDSGPETVSLIAPNHKIISTMSYENPAESLSLNFSAKWYQAEPTPGKENAPDPRTQTYPQILLTEILPNPTGEESQREYIELYNPLDVPVDLKNWILQDASATGHYVFSDNLFIAPYSYHVLYRDTFIFALNNSKETISLVAPNSQPMSKISYITSRENISYSYDISNKKWRWTKHLTPDAKNIFNDLPHISQIEISPIAYKNVYTNFTVNAEDPNNEQLAVRWDFGDDHRSYLWDTRHKYVSEGIYHGSLRIQDESEEIMHHFTVTVKKYPKYDLKINKIAPNPSGKDTGMEYLMIHNRSKKDIDLNGWSIATGSTKKTLVNHPVNRKFTIKKGGLKMMTHKYAAITLPNKSGFIELRRPDGTVADHISYGDASRSIKNDATFALIDNKWTWLIPEDLTKKQKTLAIIMQAIANEDALYQQKKEREIAYVKIHAPKKNNPMYLAHTRFSFLTHLSEKINIFLVKHIPYIQKELIVLWKEHTKTKWEPAVYKIANAKSRCAITPIFALNNSKYDFCVENKSDLSFIENF